jgi:hypothetical protein
VLEVTYFGQLDQSETAALLGVPVGTVKSRTYYALRSLKAILGEDRPDGDSERREVRPALASNAPVAPSICPSGDDLIAA